MDGHTVRHRNRQSDSTLNHEIMQLLAFYSNKRAKMALVCSPEFLRLPQPFFFFVPFREEFTRISLCLYSASNPHSLIPCLLTDQNSQTIFEKGHSRNISLKLFQNITSSFREDGFPRICSCLYSESSPHSPEPCSLIDQNLANNF